MGVGGKEGGKKGRWKENDEKVGRKKSGTREGTRRCKKGVMGAGEEVVEKGGIEEREGIDTDVYKVGGTDPEISGPESGPEKSKFSFMGGGGKFRGRKPRNSKKF